MRRFLAERISKWFCGDVIAPGGTQNVLTCGTLRYTPATLVVLFGWLLWGDFTLTFMESLPGLLVMQLKDHKEISNEAIVILLSTLATVCNIVLNPVISYSSDRHRSRWGRRRPFLMFATPFVALFLITIPWSPEITTGLLKLDWARSILSLFPLAPLVLVFGFLIVGFQVFNMFICTTYFYLIPDTVPEPLIGRFYGLFRVFGLLAYIGFTWFLGGQAHQHMKLIFALFAGLYAVSFILMCVKVREGDYPEIKEEHGRWYSPIKNYFGECFGNLRNWVIFLAYAAIQWASCAGVFTLLFYRDQIHLTETEYFRLASASSVACLLLSMPFGALVDRLGSQKSLMIGLCSGIVICLTSFLFIHSRTSAFILGFMMQVPVFVIILALNKWTVDMYPRTQYGQYGSAGAIVGAVGIMLLGPLAGKLVDLLDNYYRLCLIAPGIFYALCLVFNLILFRWPKPGTSEAEVAVPIPEVVD